MVNYGALVRLLIYGYANRFLCPAYVPQDALYCIGYDLESGISADDYIHGEVDGASAADGKPLVPGIVLSQWKASYKFCYVYF